MKNILFPRVLLMATISIFLISCQNGCGKKEKSIIPGKLSIFSISTQEFLKLKPFEKDSGQLGSLYLNFQVDKEKFNMTGWQDGQQDPNGTTRPGFGTEPDIKINHIRSSEMSYSNGMFLGSIIFNNKEVKDLMAAIRQIGNPYLVFTPKQSLKNPNIIYYQLSASNSPSGLDKDFVPGKEQTAFKSTILPFPGCPMPPGCGGIEVEM
jgi:hypothetical protein